MPTLAKTYTVVAPDFRGYGQSDKPETGYEVQTMVEDLRQLLDQLGIKSANVVGHDLGGIVAYVYAAEHRDQVSQLGIIEAPIIGVPSPTMQRVLASYWHIGFYAHPRLPELLIAGRERDYLAEFIRTYQHNREAFDKEDLDEYAHHIASPGGLRGMLGVYRAIAGEAQDLIQLTHTKLTVPAWAVGGDHSMGMGPFEQFHHLAETVTGGVIENCGHWVIEEQPDRVLEDLGEFLRQ
jgi:pimeloyl-ACP methyl ester carboxylesterase